MNESDPVLQAIARRRSVRQYLDKPVPRDAVDAMLKAAMAAPSAKNVQPWRFSVVNRREVLAALAEVLQFGKMLRQAPLAIMVGADLAVAEEGTPGYDYWKQDCSAATMNLLLAAEAMGLGAVWLGVTPVPERVADVGRILALPETVAPLGLVSIGYPNDSAMARDKYDPAKIDWQHWSE